MTLKVLAASVILKRNPRDLWQEISEIVVDCDCDSEGYHSPDYADPGTMGLREILSFFRFEPGARFVRRFVEF